MSLRGRRLAARILALAALAGAMGPVVYAADDSAEEDRALRHLSVLDYRLIGPYRGGRVTAVAGHPDQLFTFYMGSTGGGVWRTTNAGESWENLTDGFVGAGSVGAVTVAPSDPNVLWVGMGSACPRGNVSVGDGVYRSTDAGRTWQRVGLENAGQIGRIRVHPDDPDRAWVAVLGSVFGPGEERGVYRTEDGGASWERVLHVSETAGAVELALDETNPRILYAAIWRAERKPWTMIDGGEESGLWRSVDGGDSWEELGGGLPEGVLGRIGVSTSPARPGRVWALVTADEDRGGVFRSDDWGESWKRVSSDRELQQRGWYYSHIDAHPADPDTVFVSNVRFWRSVDGGATWERVATPHGDNHALWINPRRPELMVQGNDGGANVSVDGGDSWSTQHNQPTAEFYRVTVDAQFPYRVYGAQQDNSTISVPSWSLADITPEQYWYSVAGAESGHIAVDPRNPDLIYAGNYLGRIDRLDRREGRAENVILYPQMQDGTAPRDLTYRFQWNAPILISRHDPDTVYHASNYVHRTRDAGRTWRTISPDLTRDDPEQQELPGGPVQHDHTGVEVYNTIFVLAESPHRSEELWAGSDDGRVHVTRDGGESWLDVTPADLPVDATVNSIDVSPFDDGSAVLAAYRYRLDDFRPYVYRTRDGGASWRRAVAGIPDDHPVRVVRFDPGREGLLWAGTEFGMFVSFDLGDSWEPFQLDLPRTPVTDLVVQGDDLVVATQGRSFWILDQLGLARQAGGETPAEDLVLYRPAPALRVQGRGFSGPRAPEAPPQGAVLHFWIGGELAQRLGVDDGSPEDGSGGDGGATGEEEQVFAELTIEDGAGEVLRRFRSDAPEEPGPADRWRPVPVEELELEAGMNRFVWDLRGAPPTLVPGAVMSLAYTGGPWVAPGGYLARLRVGSSERVAPVVVAPDPRRGTVSAEEWRAQERFVTEVRDRLSEIHRRIRDLRSVRGQIERSVELAELAGLADEAREEIEAAAEVLRKRIDGAEEALIQTRSRAGQDPINFPPKIDDQFAYLYSHAVLNDGAPTAGTVERFRDLQAEVAPLMSAAAEVLGQPLEEWNEMLGRHGLLGVVVPADAAAR